MDKYLCLLQRLKVAFTVIGPWGKRAHCKEDHANLQRADVSGMIRNVPAMPFILSSEQGGYGWGWRRLSQATECKQSIVVLSSSLFKVLPLRNKDGAWSEDNRRDCPSSRWGRSWHGADTPLQCCYIVPSACPTALPPVLVFWQKENHHGSQGKLLDNKHDIVSLNVNWNDSISLLDRVPILLNSMVTPCLCSQMLISVTNTNKTTIYKEMVSEL